MRSSTCFLCSELSNVVSRIKQASSNGNWRSVLSGYREMQRLGIPLKDPLIVPLVLKSCAKLLVHSLGESVHANLIKKDFDSFTSVGNSVVDFYMKFGDIDSAIRKFDCMSCRDSVSWNIIVLGILDHGFSEEGLRWFWKARFSGFEPNVSTLVLVIQACQSLCADLDGERIQGYVIKTGVLGVSSVQNSILNLYAEADIIYAQKMFDEMPVKDVISWSMMIRGYIQGQDPVLGLQLFHKMLRESGIKPDGITITSVLKACAAMEDLDLARLFHGFVIRKGFGSADLFVGNSLIDVYFRCNDTDSAFKVFMEMSQRNIVSWNSMMSGFVQNEKFLEALSLFYQMGKEGFEMDEVTLVNLFHICKVLVYPLSCKSIHCVMIRRSYETNELVINSLIDAYTNFNLVKHARAIFDGMKNKDVVSWSTMISGLTRCGKPYEAITVFCEMNENPNSITVLNLLKACSVSADLQKSKWAHGISVRKFFACNVSVGTAIVDMYAKCGAMELAKTAFDQIPRKNIISWSALISAYGMNGLARKAFGFLNEMKQEGLNPNEITILSALSACSHGGLIKEGLEIFKSMVQDYGLKPSLQHYSCVVDMLSRAGELEIAMEVIKNLWEGLEAGPSAWGAVLSGCRSYKNSELGSEALSEILELDPLSSSGYLLGSSIFASGKLWDDASKMRRLVKERRVKVITGYSLVYVGDVAVRFVAGDGSNSKTSEINCAVQKLHCWMKIDESKNWFCC